MDCPACGAPLEPWGAVLEQSRWWVCAAVACARRWLIRNGVVIRQGW